MRTIENIQPHPSFIGACAIDPAQFGQKLPDIEVHKNIELNERAWDLRISRLCPNRSISVDLNGDFLCDGRDLSAKPLCFRLHMYIGASRGKDVPFELKHERMKNWQEALLVYDSLMRSDVDTDSIDSLTQLLTDGFLPQADLAILDTNNASLASLFTTLGFSVNPQPPHPFVVRWNELVTAAQSRRIVSEWLRLKG